MLRLHVGCFVRVEQHRKGTLMTPDIKRILVPLDFSVNSSRALDYAHGMAVQFGAAIHLVHVCEVPTLMSASMDAYAIAYSDWSQRLGEEAEMQLLREKARLTDVKMTTEVLFGNPAASIIDAAGANHADLIVMGTHGHGAVMHMVMGNVAERVVRGAPCPVLTVREPRVKEVDRGLAKKLAVAGTVLAAFLLIPAAASAQDQPIKQSTPGAETFKNGIARPAMAPSARGDGPLRRVDAPQAGETQRDSQSGTAACFRPKLISKVIDGTAAGSGATAVPTCRR